MAVLKNNIIESVEIDKYKDIQSKLMKNGCDNQHQKQKNLNDEKRELGTIKPAGQTEILTKQEAIARAKEIKKCKDDILYFCRKYFKIVSLSKGLITLDPYPKQAELLKFIQDNNRSIICASRQTGKCLSGSTHITIRHKKYHWIKISIPIGLMYYMSKVKDTICNFIRKLYN